MLAYAMLQQLFTSVLWKRFEMTPASHLEGRRYIWQPRYYELILNSVVFRELPLFPCALWVPPKKRERSLKGFVCANGDGNSGSERGWLLLLEPICTSGSGASREDAKRADHVRYANHRVIANTIERACPRQLRTYPVVVGPVMPNSNSR